MGLPKYSVTEHMSNYYPEMVSGVSQCQMYSLDS